jgi:hypothetical protein
MGIAKIERNSKSKGGGDGGWGGGLSNVYD